MELLAQMLFYALLAITAENLIFTGGFGFSRLLRAARRPKIMFSYAFLLGGFTLLSAWMGIGLNQAMPINSSAVFYRPTIFAVCTAVVYFLAAFIYKTWWPVRYKKVEPVLSSSAINCVVLAMPFLQRVFHMNAWQTMGYALGTAIAFLFGVVVLSQAMGRLKNPDMPKAFQGLPSIFIYVGILSLAFFGFIGGRLF